MTARLRVRVRGGWLATVCATVSGLLIDAALPLMVRGYGVAAVLCAVGAVALAPGWLRVAVRAGRGVTKGGAS